MMYTIQYKEQALRDALKLQKSEPMAYRKLQHLMEELAEHPYSGTGKPERLRGGVRGYGVGASPRSIAWCIGCMSMRLWSWCYLHTGIMMISKLWDDYYNLPQRNELWESIP